MQTPPPQELLDIFDEDNHPLHIQRPRAEVHAKGYWHRTVHVWMYTPDQILLQLRAKDKASHPDKWDVAVAGHILAGTDSLEGAVREIHEEIGLKMSHKDLQLIQILKGDFGMNKEFIYVYVSKFTQDISQLILQKEEVQEMRLMSPDTLRDDLHAKSDHYVPHGDYWFEMIQTIVERQGSRATR